MLIPSGMTCKKCGQPVRESDYIKITNIGKVQRVGGLGLMRDALTFRGTERVEHVNDCTKKGQ